MIVDSTMARSPLPGAHTERAQLYRSMQALTAPWRAGAPSEGLRMIHSNYQQQAEAVNVRQLGMRTLLSRW